jgi:AcrR family transcriptional regulator
MAENATRQNIILEADKLFYHCGYDHTSFADIAGAVGISRGNFYHHFKTKDEILAAVISMRFDRTKEMLEQWGQQATHPLDRIKSFINILIVNQTRIMQHGCPVGSLCVELTKLNHDSQEHANEIFLLFKHWLRRQFLLLGRKSNADTLAMHLLARSQGIAVMASTIADTKFINQEVHMLYKWVDGCA